MANTQFREEVKCLQNDLVILEGHVAIGGTGAVGTTAGAGISSVARTGTGAYTITLTQAFNRFLGLSACFSGSGASSVFIVQVNSAAVDTDIKASEVKIICRDASGSAVDPTNGNVMHFVIQARKSAVKGAGE
jgi:3,4-dihydroxy-2-butanone 4-phosphate synthase